MTASVLDLSPEHPARASPRILADDRVHLEQIARAVDHERVRTRARRDRVAAERIAVGGQAVERDREIQRLTARLSVLGRFDADLCLGRMSLRGRSEPVYVGRAALRSEEGRRLLIDWRAPGAVPFFAATAGDPRGLASRRRYRWRSGRVVDLWDEAFTDDPGVMDDLVLDEQSAFIASLGARRDGRMRDVLTTI